MRGGYRIINALTTDVPFDLQCPMMSLPQRFGTELASIPAAARFSIPAALQTKWVVRFQKERTNVGLVWAGNPRHFNDGARSLPPGHLLPLTRLPGIHCCSLQVGTAPADVPDGIVDLARELTDFGETAAVIAALDLIITVDTAVAHLAGSLGKRVWVLLPYTSDWRWMLDREDSPWYPSMRLFRQKQPGGWDEVVARVVSELSSEPAQNADDQPTPN